MAVIKDVEDHGQTIKKAAYDQANEFMFHEASGQLRDIQRLREMVTPIIEQVYAVIESA